MSLTSIVCVIVVIWLVVRDDRRVVDVADCQDILDLFDRLDYRTDDWMVGDIPRIAFTCSPAHWCRLSGDDVPVAFRKSMFLMAVAPLVLMANEAVLEERLTLAGIDTERKVRDGVTDLAQRYGVIDDGTTDVTAPHLGELLRRVDSIPPSLALAQGAVESGWGTSRFALEGKALFGQIVWSESGMTPSQPKAELGTYGVRRFDTLLASVEAYLFNLNTHRAYEGMRRQRASPGGNDGSVLVEHLESYSENRRGYIESLMNVIAANSLQRLDDARLRDGRTWIVGRRC